LVCNSVLEEIADEDAFFVADGGKKTNMNERIINKHE